jgi:NDP-sugar pyrophosphorylase family protein
VSVEEVTSAYRESGLATLMTVFRNEGRWEKSNAVFDGRIVTRYEKHSPAPPPEMVFVDYGLLVLDPLVLKEFVTAGEVVDLADVLRQLSTSGRLAGFEASQRFFEIGTPEGLHALERHLATTHDGVQ